MFDDDSIKSYARKTKQFVKENRTFAACALTALITARITHEAAVNHCVSKITPVLNDLWRENEQAAIRNEFLLEFIARKNLGSELSKEVLTVTR